MKNSLISLILSLSLLLTTSSYTADVVFLNKNDPAPYPGFLFDSDKAKVTRQRLLDEDTDKQLIDSLKKSLDLQSKISDLNQNKVNICVTQIDSLSKSVNDSKNLTDLQKFFWFGMGILTFGLVLYGVNKLK